MQDNHSKYLQTTHRNIKTTNNHQNKTTQIPKQQIQKHQIYQIHKQIVKANLIIKHQKPQKDHTNQRKTTIYQISDKFCPTKPKAKTKRINQTQAQTSNPKNSKQTQQNPKQPEIRSSRQTTQTNNPPFKETTKPIISKVSVYNNQTLKLHSEEPKSPKTTKQQNPETPKLLTTQV